MTRQLHKSGKYDDLTEDQIRALSIEMRCCFFLQPWNTLINPTSPEEWADGIGYFRYSTPSEALEQADELYSFIIELSKEEGELRLKRNK